MASDESILGTPSKNKMSFFVSVSSFFGFGGDDELTTRLLYEDEESPVEVRRPQPEMVVAPSPRVERTIYTGIDDKLGIDDIQSLYTSLNTGGGSPRGMRACPQPSSWPDRLRGWVVSCFRSVRRLFQRHDYSPVSQENRDYSALTD